MTDNVKSFPVKLPALEEQIQHLREYNPTVCYMIMVDDKRGISAMFPPDASFYEINWALDIVKQGLFYEDED